MLEKYRIKLQENKGVPCKSSRANFVGLSASADKQADKNSILQTVYARVKETGKPCNDLALVENVHLAPNVREFIKMNLQSPVEPEKGIVDYEFAQEIARKPYETVNEYKERLTTIAYKGEEMIKSSSKYVKKIKDTLKK